MKNIVLLLCLVAATNALKFSDVFKEQWNTFKMMHKKNYESHLVDNYRRKIYAINMHKIAKHNQKFAQGLVSYRMKPNQYADLLHTEFIQVMNGFNKTAKDDFRRTVATKNRGATFISPAHVSIPDQVDWRKMGAVTEVKNQGRCGSCWAFSATGALEGQHFRKTGCLVSLSEQNLIDCSSEYATNGCKGGNMDDAFLYVKGNHGIDTEKSYPYEAVDGKSCRYDPKNIGAEDVGFVDIPVGDEDKLKEAVATIGPVSVAIDASKKSFQFYSDGVYDENQCSSSKLDHGVLVVGYGTDADGRDYWLIKNSWGNTWGEDGYIKMSRNKKNQCGVATMASYPLV